MVLFELLRASNRGISEIACPIYVVFYTHHMPFCPPDHHQQTMAFPSFPSGPRAHIHTTSGQRRSIPGHHTSWKIMGSLAQTECMHACERPTISNDSSSPPRAATSQEMCFLVHGCTICTMDGWTGPERGRSRQWKKRAGTFPIGKCIHCFGISACWERARAARAARAGTEAAAELSLRKEMIVGSLILEANQLLPHPAFV